MQVCPGGTAGLPCRAQYLPGLYRFTGTHIQVLQVRIKGLGAVRVQQLQAEAERIKGAVDTLRSTAEQLA